MNVTVYCAATPGKNPHFRAAARELGEWIVREGHELVYGGSSVGLMGIVAGAVLAGGGHVTGVEPRFFLEAGVAQHDVDVLIETDTMAERKEKMIELGDAFVALPGGMGTLEEITEIMSRIRLKFTALPCIFLNIDGFYDPVRTLLESMLEQGFIEQQDFDAVAFPSSVDELAQLLK